MMHRCIAILFRAERANLSIIERTRQGLTRRRPSPSAGLIPWPPNPTASFILMVFPRERASAFRRESGIDG